MTKFYFAEDGNWGDANGLSIVDTDNLDDHFIEQVDHIREYYRAEWADWFTRNNHAFKDNGEDYGICVYCELFEDGSLSEIEAELADGEDKE